MQQFFIKCLVATAGVRKSPKMGPGLRELLFGSRGNGMEQLTMQMEC